MMKKAIIAASTMALLSGCVTFQGDPCGYTPKLFSANSGTSLRVVTEALAANYGLTSVHWHPSLAKANQPLILAVGFDVNQLFAEEAFDALYEHTDYANNMECL